MGTIFQDQDFADLYSDIAYFAESKPVNAMTLFRMLFMAAAAISLFFVLVFAQPREDPGLTLRRGIVDSISISLSPYKVDSFPME